MRHTNCACLFLFVVCAGAALSQEPPEEVRPPRGFEPQVVEPLEPFHEPMQPPQEAHRPGDMPSVIAGLPVGVAILGAGVVGWVVLGLTVWFIERPGGKRTAGL